MANKFNNYNLTAGYGYGVSNPIPIYNTILNAPSGYVDFYTCPPNKLAFFPTYCAQNTASSNTRIIRSIKISGSYYFTNAGNFISSGGNIIAGFEPMINPGESFAINIAQPGMNFQYTVIEIEISSPLKAPRLTNFINGNNTLYTCPAGANAIILNATVPSAANIGNGTGLQGCVGYSNNSGGSRTLTTYIVPNGDSPSSTNQISPATVIINTNTNSPITPVVLNPGDFISFSTDSNASTQFGWANILEIPQ